MNIILVLTILIFLLLLFINYSGSVGRIERKNKITGEYQDLGPVSEKEEIALFRRYT